MTIVVANHRFERTLVDGRSSFCWGTSPWRPLKDTWAASNAYGTRWTTRSDWSCRLPVTVSRPLLPGRTTADLAWRLDLEPKNVVILKRACPSTPPCSNAGRNVHMFRAVTCGDLSRWKTATERRPSCGAR